MDPYHQGNYGPPPPGYHPGGNVANAQATYMAPPVAYIPPPQMMSYHNGYPHMQLNQPVFPPMNNFQYQQPAMSMPPPHMPSYTPSSTNFSNSITSSSITTGTISAQSTTRPVGRTITLYIGSIPPGITDENIEAILRCCGTFDQWKRLKSSDGTPKKFGLADFTDPESLLRTWRVMNNPSQPIAIPSLSEDVESAPLILKLEDDIQLYLNQYKATRTTDKTQDDESDLLARNKILEAIKAFSNSEKKDNASLRSGSSPRSESSYRYRRDREDQDDDDPSELAAISRYKNQEEQRTRQRAVEYYDRLKQWEEREIYRAKAHDRNQIRDLELEERRAIDRKEHGLRFQEWDDDKERDLGREDYYKDRARWWERRQVIRRRELEADEADRERLRQEIEAEEVKKRDLENQAKAHEFLLDPDIDEKRLGPGKVKFSLAPSGGSLLRGRPRPALGESAGNPDDDEELEAAARKARRVLVPLEYSDSEEDKSRSYKSSRREISRTEQLRMLMESIPSGRSELFNWEIKWSYLDEASLVKVRNFAGKKIVEYLGVEEPTLLNFILGILKSHSPPDVLVEELEKALDEEGATFVMKIWRMVIFETEANAQGLR